MTAATRGHGFRPPTDRDLPGGREHVGRGMKASPVATSSGRRSCRRSCNPRTSQRTLQHRGQTEANVGYRYPRATDRAPISSEAGPSPFPSPSGAWNEGAGFPTISAERAPDQGKRIGTETATAGVFDPGVFLARQRREVVSTLIYESWSSDSPHPSSVLSPVPKSSIPPYTEERAR